MTVAIIQSGSYVATGIYNLDSARNVAAPRDTRKEGWTETWGTSSDSHDKLEESIHSRFDIDKEAISSLLATPHPQIPIVLTQFRPAWIEQLVLSIAAVPFCVVNSNHSTNEATGRLPFLRDHSDVSKSPILVGRHHPTNIATSVPMAGNHILEYIESHSTITLDLDASLTSKQRSLSQCWLSMLQLELETILCYLRFEDSDAWEQVYRRQYLHATVHNGNGNDRWWSYLPGRFQACAERVNSRRKLSETNLDVPRAIARARQAYRAFEDQLNDDTNGVDNGDDLRRRQSRYLFKTAKPTLIDVALWAHLAEALCDVHLVVVLADFKNLTAFFQTIYTEYFQKGDSEWQVWNRNQNQRNAFQQLPFQSQKKKLDASTFKDAIELMQRLSLQNQDLSHVLETTKAQRSAEPWPKPVEPTKTLFYRWQMGEDLNKSKESDIDPQQEQQNSIRKKLMRDQARNDQLWISGVLGVSAIAILLLQGNKAQS